ncbi:MAG: PQQ-binding-like beta-propeller repeat protein, partial [Pirellulales bacterium]|nr:PQQ-binding-like beta-propeller repeat protein [Pirellulales bacterium]
PGDAQELFALDAASGAVRWSAAPPSPAARLLALDDDWLLLGGDRLCRLDIDTGRLDSQWGRDVEPAAGEGTVAGALVFWPTMLDVMLIDRQTGQPTGESLPLGSPGGANLLVVESNAAGSGSRARLLAAGPEQATAYGR